MKSKGEIYKRLHDVSSRQRGTERGTQQENSATQLGDKCRRPCNSVLDRVNEALRWILLTQFFDKGLAWLNISSEGNERGQLQGKKNKLTRFPTWLQGA